MKLRKDFPPEIRNIIFDIGNVLIDIDTEATLRAFRELGVGNLAVEDIHPHQTGFLLDYELGTIPDEAFADGIRNLAGREIAPERIWAAWNAMIPSVDMARFERVRQLDGYRLFVLSNTNHQHIAHVRRLFREMSGGTEFEAFFEKCYYSHEMRLRKPDPEVYRRVVDEAGIIPAQTLFIDDNACNFSGAQALHLKTYHLTGKETIVDLFEPTV